MAMKSTKRLKQQSDYKLRKRGELRLKVLEFLENNPCEICGEDDPLVLEFDHVDQKDKSLPVSRLVNNCSSWETIVAEIGKCRVLCANCHRRYTHEQLGFWSQL